MGWVKCGVIPEKEKYDIFELEKIYFSQHWFRQRIEKKINENGGKM